MYNLAFVKNGRNKTYLSDYNEQEIYRLTPVQGEIIIHDADIWHCMDVHKSDLPRTAFVFTVKYEE